MIRPEKEVTDKELIELLRRMSPRLDMLDCENVLAAADCIEVLLFHFDQAMLGWTNTINEMEALELENRQLQKEIMKMKHADL